jgi:flagellar biosynthesis anti-sigma factor FlgM
MDRALEIQAASSRQEHIVKIDAYRNVSQEALDSVARPSSAAGNRATAGSSAAPAASDEVRLSSDARLMQAAMESAQQTPNIRPEVVEKMRAALANGQIGNDPHALADALLDRLTGASAEK